MSKRLNPFENGLSLHKRVKVEQKEHGKRGGNIVVKDKTYRKLFDASKQFYDEPTANLENSFTTKIENGHNTKDLPEFCCSCNELNVVEYKCSFCDKWVCNSCGLPCLKCQDMFCPSHSFKMHLRTMNCLCHNCIGEINQNEQ